MSAALVLGLGALGAAAGYAAEPRPACIAAGAAVGVVAGLVASGVGASSGPPAPGGGGGGVDVFRTPPGAAIVHPSGWVRVGEVEVMRLPMLDARSGLFARLSYGDLLQVAAREGQGAQLCTMATLRDAWRVGVRLRPVQLVRTAADAARMMGRAMCDEHDLAVLEQLAAHVGDPRVVANCGKQWVRAVPPDVVSPGRARNGGWFDAQGVPVQPGGRGSEHHDRSYTDYSQLATLERPAGIA